MKINLFDKLVEFVHAKKLDELKATAKNIREHSSHTLLLVSNDSDINDNLINTGHRYDLTHVIDVCEYSHLYFYLATKLK